jgi:hypothetical protein
MYLPKALFGLAEGTDLSPVDGFSQGQCVAIVEGTPAKGEQLAWAKGFSHVEDEQKAISSRGVSQNQPKLFPLQDLVVLRPEILGNLQLAGRVLEQKLLLDGFVEDRSQVGTGLLDTVLAIPICKLVDVRLQHESVD